MIELQSQLEVLGDHITAITPGHATTGHHRRPRWPHLRLFRRREASHELACAWEEHFAAPRAAEGVPAPAAGDLRRRRGWLLKQPRQEHVDSQGEEHPADQHEVPVDDGRRRHRVPHAALLTLGVLLPDVPVLELFEGFDRELGAALAVHLVAQSERGRLVARLVDRGEQRSAQLLGRDHHGIRERPGAEAVLDGEPRELELVDCKGCHERGDARAEAGGARAGTTMVSDRCHLGEEPLVRDTAGDEHVIGRPRSHLGRVGFGGVELVEADPEELATA
eukprot:scaffold19644_cov63-Phaeocystis_antarctica.AAC.3